MRTRGAGAALRGARGFTLVELMVAGLIFVVVGLGLGSLYVSTQRAYLYSSSQAYVQRQGTAMQRLLTQKLQSAEAVQIVGCGPQNTANMAVLVLSAGEPPNVAFGTVFCYYEFQEATDTFPQLYRCTIPTFTATTSCTDGTKVNLLGLLRDPSQASIGGSLRVSNTRFFLVTCIEGSTGACGDSGRQVTTPLIDVRFDITDGTLVNPNTVQGDLGVAARSLRFAFAVTTRN